eukprot:GHUV01033968.1.p1 GENE.GHUV01033968.1~~GHUV01033968.1.p1  ORF type:complete len:200 (-),score=48.78 GHUV01033968.1:445-1044(-)
MAPWYVHCPMSNTVNISHVLFMCLQYLSLHFGPLEIAFADFLAEIGILADGLEFPKKCGDLVLHWAANNKVSKGRALDLGCAVGRSSFEIAREFQEVIGIDLSQTFIDMANTMKQQKQVEYSLKVEGDITEVAVASIDDAIDTSRCAFQQVRSAGISRLAKQLCYYVHKKALSQQGCQVPLGSLLLWPNCTASSKLPSC